MTKRERVDFTPSGKPVVHGSASTYNNHKCGCDDCRAAWAKYVHDRGYVTKFRDKQKKSQRGTKIKL